MGRFHSDWRRHPGGFHEIRWDVTRGETDFSGGAGALAAGGAAALGGGSRLPSPPSDHSTIAMHGCSCCRRQPSSPPVHGVLLSSTDLASVPVICSLFCSCKRSRLSLGVTRFSKSTRGPPLGTYRGRAVAVILFSLSIDADLPKVTLKWTWRHPSGVIQGRSRGRRVSDDRRPSLNDGRLTRSPSPRADRKRRQCQETIPVRDQGTRASDGRWTRRTWGPTMSSNCIKLQLLDPRPPGAVCSPPQYLR